jgi:hypothetical protein
MQPLASRIIVSFSSRGNEEATTQLSAAAIIRGPTKLHDFIDPFHVEKW